MRKEAAQVPRLGADDGERHGDPRKQLGGVVGHEAAVRRTAADQARKWRPLLDRLK